MSLDEAFAKVIGEREAALLRPVASQLGVAAREYGFLELYVFPSLDAVLAAALVLRVMRGSRADVVVYFSPVPPGELVEPSLLLGYPASWAQDLRARKPSALIGYGEKPQGILPVAVAASPGSSVAGLTAAVLSEITVVGAYSVLALPAALWLGLDTGKKGELNGIEASIVEMLRLENKVEEVFSLRLARWLFRPTEEALRLTMTPFLPGLTGRREEAEKLLSSDPRLAQLQGRTMEEAPEEAVAVLGEKLYQLLKEASRVPRRPTEIIGVNYYARWVQLPDLREAAAVLACCSTALGLDALLAAGLESSRVFAACHYEYMRRFEETAGFIERGSSEKHSPARVAGVAVARLGEAPCPLLVEAELRKLGAIPQDAVAFFGSDAGGGLVSLESLARTVGFGQVKELYEKGCLAHEGGSPLARLEQQRCR